MGGVLLGEWVGGEWVNGWVGGWTKRYGSGEEALGLGPLHSVSTAPTHLPATPM